MAKTKTHKGSIALVGSEQNLRHLKEILNFFKVPFEENPSCARLQEYALTIFYGRYVHTLNKTSEPMLCIPSYTQEFQRYLADLNVRVRPLGRKVQLRLRHSSSLVVSTILNPYLFNGPLDDLASLKEFPLITRVRGTNIHLLGLDLVKEIAHLFRERLNLHPNLPFRFYPWLPATSLIPAWLGNAILQRIACAEISPSAFLSNIGSLDGLRYLLLASIAIATQRPVKTLWFWKKGIRYTFTITHDIDTRYGFDEGMGTLRNVEKRYGIRSAWYIPTECYPIRIETIRALVSDGCEIGSHGCRHDGKLILSTEDDVVETLQRSKLLLTRFSSRQVKGFRAPLLQHTQRIFQAVKRCDFLYDSSLPAWEMYSRTSGKPHGIGTIYPFALPNHLIELPVTLPQDHQLIYLGGLRSEEVLELWRDLIRHIKSLGGLCNIIIHPDRDLFGHENMISYYEELIKEIIIDADCWLTTPSEVAEWWMLRDHIDLIEERPSLTLEAGFNCSDESEEIAELVEYRPSDFVFE